MHTVFIVTCWLSGASVPQLYPLEGVQAWLAAGSLLVGQ
jgi:hypothetical protein